MTLTHWAEKVIFWKFAKVRQYFPSVSSEVGFDCLFWQPLTISDEFQACPELWGPIRPKIQTTYEGETTIPFHAQWAEKVIFWKFSKVRQYFPSESSEVGFDCLFWQPLTIPDKSQACPEL